MFAPAHVATFRPAITSDWFDALSGLSPPSSPWGNAWRCGRWIAPSLRAAGEAIQTCLPTGLPRRCASRN